MVGGPADAMLRRHTEKFARTTANALKTLPESWVVLHDVRWPGRPFASIDLIAVGPGGVFVIDLKRWTGRVQLSDGVLRQNGRRREREVLSVREAAAAVSRRLGHLPSAWLTPVLCIVGSDVAGWSGPVAVCHKANLVQLLTTRPEVLAPDVVRSVVNDLRLQLKEAEPAAPDPSTLSLLERARAGMAAPLAGIAFAALLAMGPTIAVTAADGVASLFTGTVHSGTLPDEAP